jgi:hypothetical protein
MAISLASTALTIQESTIRLKELWENLEQRYGEPTVEPYRVEQLMAKLEDCPGLRFLQDLSAY